MHEAMNFNYAQYATCHNMMLMKIYQCILFVLGCILFPLPNFLQGHRKHGEAVEQSVPTLIQTNTNDDLLHWNDNSMQGYVRKSRLGRGKETIFV